MVIGARRGEACAARDKSRPRRRRTLTSPRASPTEENPLIPDRPDADRPSDPGAPEPGAPPVRTAGPAQLSLLLAASCMPVLGSVLIAPVLPQLGRHFAATPGADVLVPVVLTVPALVLGLTAAFAGVVADRIDRRRVLLGAMAGYSVVGTAPLYLDSLMAILASRVLLGVFEAAIITCCTALIGDYWSGARRARYLGMQALVASSAATLFLLVGGALGSLGWRAPFWIYLAAVLLVVPMARLLWRPERPDRPDRPDRSRPDAAERTAAVPWRLLLVPCLVTLFSGVLFYALPVQLPFVLTAAGAGSAGQIGGISALMSLGTAAGAALFGKLAGLSPRVLVPAELGLAAAGLGVVFAAPSVPVVIAGAVVTGFGTGLLLPTMIVWAVDRLDFEQRGRGTGLCAGALFFGQFLSPLAVAALGAGTGGTLPGLGVLGAVAAVVGVGVLLLLRRRTEGLTSPGRFRRPGPGP
ncbi:MFS transporter [Nocardiopsis aegyptia]|uniref:MFS family permease n=1 Tax=Nocardiopsis aegyptia TaxID=220378 RepID=A0A7Z0J8I6_9ACTN|nr:MFS transporter [Nocardiopsis aegyptia]NYJ32762.1 MFS family permease [Nocardiopsis aegyptia]